MIFSLFPFVLPPSIPFFLFSPSPYNRRTIGIDGSASEGKEPSEERSTKRLSRNILSGMSPRVKGRWKGVLGYRERKRERAKDNW